MGRGVRSWIGGFTLSGAAGLLAWGLFAPGFNTSTRPGERLRVDHPQRILGAVAAGREQEVVFRITNAGDTPLEIVGMSFS